MSELEERVETEASVTEAEADNMESASPMAEEAAPETEAAAPAAEESEPVMEAEPSAASETTGTEEAAPEAESRAADNSWYESAGYRPEEKPPVYADAHFEPAGSTTTPPRYYTPPVRQEKEKRTCLSFTGFSSRSMFSSRFSRLSAALMLFSRLKER